MNHFSASRLIAPLLAPLLLALSIACFSSAAQRIAFVSLVDGDPEIYLLDPKTGEALPLTSNGSADPGGPRPLLLEVPDPIGGDYEDYLVCMRRLQRASERCAAWLLAGAATHDGPPPLGSARWPFPMGVSRRSAEHTTARPGSGAPDSTSPRRGSPI